MLGVGEAATAQEVQRACRTLAPKLHPDVSKAALLGESAGCASKGASNALGGSFGGLHRNPNAFRGGEA